jgi:hypothetical protein
LLPAKLQQPNRRIIQPSRAIDDDEPLPVEVRVA